MGTRLSPNQSTKSPALAARRKQLKQRSMELRAQRELWNRRFSELKAKKEQWKQGFSELKAKRRTRLSPGGKLPALAVRRRLLQQRSLELQAQTELWNQRLSELQEKKEVWKQGFEQQARRRTTRSEQRRHTDHKPKDSLGAQMEEMLGPQGNHEVQVATVTCTENRLHQMGLTLKTVEMHTELSEMKEDLYRAKAEMSQMRQRFNDDFEDLLKDVEEMRQCLHVDYTIGDAASSETNQEEDVELEYSDSSHHRTGEEVELGTTEVHAEGEELPPVPAKGLYVSVSLEAPTGSTDPESFDYEDYRDAPLQGMQLDLDSADWVATGMEGRTEQTFAMLREYYDVATELESLVEVSPVSEVELVFDFDTESDAGPVSPTKRVRELQRYFDDDDEQDEEFGEEHV